VKLQHTVPHALGLTRAREVLEQAFAHYQERYPHANMQRQWHGDREAQVELKVGGFKLHPRISLGETHVAVEMDVPLLARPWVPRIKERIEREIGQWLEQAKGGPRPA
jgi:hypothetical protein